MLGGASKKKKNAIRLKKRQKLKKYHRLWDRTHKMVYVIITDFTYGTEEVRRLAAVLSRKSPFFHTVQSGWWYTDSGPAEAERKYSTFPGPALPTDATRQKRSVMGGPSPRRGNASGFRITFKARGLGAHVARRARTAPPRSRITPQTSTQNFVSRRQ